MTQETNKSTDLNEASTTTGQPAQQKSVKKQDPTARWSERVRELSLKRSASGYPFKHKSLEDLEPHSVKTDFQDIIQTTKACIAKRPLTSMVIAVTAGAAIAALLSAAMSGKKRD